MECSAIVGYCLGISIIGPVKNNDYIMYLWVKK